MNLARQPTAPLTDKRGYPTQVWREYLGGLQHEIESPAWVAMFASIFRRRKKDESDALLLPLAAMVFRRRPPKIVQAAWADRAKYAALSVRPGSLLVITDQPLIFVQEAGAWEYKSGWFRETLANIPSLGTADAGVLYEITDYDHILRWSGSAWGWGTGNPSPSGMYGLFESAPTTNGWQICDGSTVARLNADGTTTNVTVPDLSTAAYLKGGTSAAAVAAASGTTDNESSHTHSIDPPSTVSGGPSGTTTVQSGSGATVASSGHTHATDIAPFTSGAGSSHNHGPGSLELRQKQGILYYRR